MKISKLSSLSAYARPEAHLTKQTTHGAIVTLFGTLVAVVLFFSEVHKFATQSAEVKMDVDMSRQTDMAIAFNISFPAIPCAALSVDMVDITGAQGGDMATSKKIDIHKYRLNAKGRRIGKREYETPHSQRAVDFGGDTIISVDIGEALKQVEEMEEEEHRHEGCSLGARLVVRKVAGKLMVSVHQQTVFMLMPQLLGDHHVPNIINMSHIIQKFQIGPSFPGQVNPMDGFNRVLDTSLGSFKYFLKVVPTVYKHYTGRHTETYQYSVSEYTVPIGDAPPHVSINYDLSPIIVHIREHPTSILHFVVRVCAVVGGAVAVTSARPWLHRTDPHNTRDSTTLRPARPGTALHCTPAIRTAPHRIASHCTALHTSISHCTAPHCTALHYTAHLKSALHCSAGQRAAALYCTALQPKP